MKRRLEAVGGILLAVTALGVLGSSAALSDEVSNSPYIDSLKDEMREKGQPADAEKRTSDSPSPYIDSIRGKLPASPHGDGETSEGYTERLKRELSPSPSGSPYLDEMKTKLGPPSTDSAIQAVKEGHSELQAKKVGDIHNAIGLRVGASMTREISSASGLQSFESMYGKNFPIELDLFYEYQPWHSEWYGNIGLFGEAGFGYYHGFGTFQFEPHKAGSTDGNFGATSQTQFRFISIPVSLGIDYRFNLFRLVRPFIMGGGTAVGFYEGRNDGIDPHTAVSFGIVGAGGVNILLDWISSTSSWDLYAEHGIKHYYLSVAYNYIQTFTGDVSFGVSGIYGGLTFEF